MLLKQRCLVIIFLDLKFSINQISKMFGITVRKVKIISEDINLIRKLNASQFNKSCLEIADFSTLQLKLKLNHIKNLLYTVVQKFDRWARRVSFIDKYECNKCKKDFKYKTIVVDNTFILHNWLLLKNIISHYPNISYGRIDRTAHRNTFQKQEISGLAEHFIGSRPSKKYLLLALRELNSKNLFHNYSI